MSTKLNIESLRRQRGEINQKIQELAGIEATEGSLTDEQTAEFSTLTDQFKELSDSMTRLEKAEQMNAETAKPVKAFNDGKAPGVHIKKEAKQYTGAGAARTVMAIAASSGDLEGAARFAADTIGDSDVSMAIETSAGTGGALVPETFHSEVIELLRPRTIVRRLNPMLVPLVNGNMTVPRHSSGATAGYVGEGSDVLATEAAFDDVKLSEKNMITLVPMSNQLIGHAGYQVETLVLNDLLGAMATREDKAFLRDDGTSDTPKGFKKTATDAGRILPFSGTADLATIDAYLDSLMLKLIESDSMLIRPGWGMSPRTFIKLAGLRDGNGNKVYPEMAQGELKGYPIEKTTTIPVNLGVGSNESEIYFADWNDVMLGESNSMSIDFSKEATYKDSGGNLVSAFARNQSLIRVVTGHDIGFRHLEGLVLGTAVTF
jgi:HK97 family phage major capsid protein